MKNIRIGDIELRCTKYLTNENKDYWEIVKWYPNCYYGKQDDFEEIEKYRYKSKSTPNWYLSGKEVFTRKQSCYTIYMVEDDDDGEEPDLRSIGGRPYRLEQEDKESLEEIINYIYKQYRYLYDQDFE